MQLFGPDNFGGSNRNYRGVHNFEGNFRPEMEHGHTWALYDQLHALRAEGAGNGRIPPGQYRADAGSFGEQMQRDGILPRIHLDMNDNAQGRMGELANGGEHFGHHRHHGRHHHQHHHHGHRGRHHHRHHRGSGFQGTGAPGRGVAPEGEANNGIRADQPLAPTDGMPMGIERPNAAPNSEAPWQSSGNSTTVPVQRGRASDMSVTTGPTITPQKIDEVLQQYHSPAYGRVSGQEVYDKSLQHGINPAVSLAFYVLESSAGTRGKGGRNNSWGNIRGGDARDGYKSYDNIHASLDHFLNLLSGSGYVGQGRTTLGSILPKYAPSADGNNPARYMEDMAGLIRKWSS